jgi:hypothetical protein
MKSTAIALLIGYLFLSLSASLFAAADDPKVLFFYREGCSECEKFSKFSVKYMINKL